MNGFTYYNIFETKGIEYIVIIAFLLILIPFWMIITKRKRIVSAIQKTIGFLKAEILKIPKGISYSKNHSWAFLQKSGVAEVGIDDWLLHLTGEIELKHLKEPGQVIKKGEPILQVINDGRSLNINSPVSGTILNSNNIIQENPELLSDDPYNNGWLLKINPDNWKADTNDYYSGDEAKNWFDNELTRFKDFIAISSGKLSKSPVILQEGGEITDNPLMKMPEEVWNDFQKEFLD